jgi:hypothetical protein
MRDTRGADQPAAMPLKEKAADDELTAEDPAAAAADRPDW